MDDNAKNACSYQVDQELLDARGINMTVEEVAGLSTSKYSERVQSLKLNEGDLAFLKGLRRRIKNRLASQNSRRRSVEHLRRLTRELRAVRACRRDALAERRALVMRRDVVRDKCASLRRHLVEILESRSDTTEVPSIEVETEIISIESRSKDLPETKTLKPDQHISVIVKNDIDRERLREELEQEDDIYERVRQELQKEREIKGTVLIEEPGERETLIIKEEPEYEDITIEDDFESQRNYYNGGNVEFHSKNLESVEDNNMRKVQNGELRIQNGELRIENGELRNFDGDLRIENGELRNFDGDLRIENGELRNFGDDLRIENGELRKFGILPESERNIFECKIGKLVTQSVNHIFNDKKKVFAKTVFISNDQLSSNIKTMVLKGSGEDEVLNLSVKEGRRKSHGRKQSAPRRIACYTDYDDGVLDLKIKKEPQ